MAFTLDLPPRYVDCANHCMDLSSLHGNGTRSFILSSRRWDSSASNLTALCISTPMKRSGSLSPSTLMTSHLLRNHLLQLTSMSNSFLIISNAVILDLPVSYLVWQLKGTALLAHSSSINTNSFLISWKNMV